MDLNEARHESQENSSDSRTLRIQLSGLRKEKEDLTSSVDQFLSGSSDCVGDEKPTTIKVALYEARKMNAELTEKLKASEKSVAGQKETIFNIGSQLAQQSMKLGDIEWKLRQKEDEKNLATQRIQALEAEKSEIIQKLEEASKEMSHHITTSAIPIPKKSDSSMHASKAAYDAEENLVSARVEDLEEQKNMANQKILVAVKQIESIDKDIHSLNIRSNHAEMSIAESAKLLEEKSKQNQLDVQKLSSLSALNVELLEEIQELKDALSSMEKGDEIQELTNTITSLRRELGSIKKTNSVAAPAIQMEGPGAVIFDDECQNCTHLSEQLKSTMDRLETELNKSKSMIQSKLTAEQEKSILNTQVIELQKKLNAAIQEVEFTNEQTELRLKSYKEMKKLIAADQEMNASRPATKDAEGGSGSIHIIVESNNGSGNISNFGTMNSAYPTLPKGSEQFTSTDQLVGHLSRATNIQLQMDAVIREKSSLQEQIRKLELKVCVAEDEAKELKAAEQRNGSLLATQMQERAELSDKVAQLQQEIANHIISKSSVEAELLVFKQQPEKKRMSLFKGSPKKTSGGSIFSPRSRTSSSEKGGDVVSPTSTTHEETVESRIIAERDKLATDLVEKSNEISKLTKEITNLSSQLTKAKQETKEAIDKNAVLIRENEETIHGLSLSHAEVEECLQNQIQELADQLMEPKPYSEVNAEAKPSEKDVSQTALKADQAKLRQVQVSLQESQLQVHDLKVKIEKLENDNAQISLKRDVDNFVNQHIIEIAQTAMEKSGELNRIEMAALEASIACLQSENEKLKTRNSQQRSPSAATHPKEIAILRGRIAELTAEVDRLKQAGYGTSKNPIVAPTESQGDTLFQLRNR
ncbi:hypothetical protein BDR26DRAFT_137445 [Obelidium mucronatum]|nr:hypothetical protein BDR26DRAFT_137445 [Obelidium mucronatum]